MSWSVADAAVEPRPYFDEACPAREYVANALEVAALSQTEPWNPGLLLGLLRSQASFEIFEIPPHSAIGQRNKFIDQLLSCLQLPP